MPHKQQAKIFIDGSNFFYYCKELEIPSYPKFDFEKLIRFLPANLEISEKSYYIGVVRAKQGDKRAIKMMAKQMSLFTYLKKNSWKINKGYLLKSNGRHHEKGVDVRLALDIALGAVDNAYDTAIIVSSDTDILPAIEQAKIRGKQIMYIGFKHRPSRAMIANCDKQILLTKSDLKNFCI